MRAPRKGTDVLIGRRDGPRFEASREGVMLIGFSRWPEPLPRTASNGRPLKHSYAERVDEIGVRASRGGRVTSVSWDEILRLSVGWQATPDAAPTPTSARPGPRSSSPSRMCTACRTRLTSRR